MRVLAIDPGERVGWAIFNVAYSHHDTEVREELTGDVIETREVMTCRLEKRGISALKPFALMLVKNIADYDVVVYENFKLTAKGARGLVGSDMQTSQLIGMIRLARWLAGEKGPKVVVQEPKDKTTALRTLPPELREVWDSLPKAHDDAHDGDAVLHGWYYYWKRFV